MMRKRDIKILKKEMTRRGEMLGDEYLELCKAHGVEPRPVMWGQTLENLADPSLPVLASVLLGDDPEEIRAPYDLLPKLVFERVRQNALGAN